MPNAIFMRKITVVSNLLEMYTDNKINGSIERWTDVIKQI